MGLPVACVAERTTGRKAQRLRSSGVMGRSSIFESVTAGSSLGAAAASSLAPAAIHCFRVSTSAGASFLPGGMAGCSVPLASSHKRLFSGLPAATMGPCSPPLAMDSDVRRSRPDIFIAAPWQAVQFVWRMVAARAERSSACESAALKRKSVVAEVVIQGIVLPILYGICQAVWGVKCPTLPIKT